MSNGPPSDATGSGQNQMPEKDLVTNPGSPAAEGTPRPAESSGPMAPADPPISTDQTSPASPAPLTKEEQWALFEKELKENDWGHQPC